MSFSRIQDEEDRYTNDILNNIRRITGNVTGMHPDDFIEKYLHKDLTPYEQQMLHDFYLVNLWWQDREDEYC